MDWDQILKANGLDRYDRNARLYPAFLCLLPLFIIIALWLPAVWTLLGGLLSLAAACGLIFSLLLRSLLIWPQSGCSHKPRRWIGRGSEGFDRSPPA